MNVDNQRRTTQIVVAYVRKNLIPTDQIAGLINSVHLTLSGLGNPPVIEEPPRVPAVDRIDRAVHRNTVAHLDPLPSYYRTGLVRRRLAQPEMARAAPLTAMVKGLAPLVHSSDLVG